MGVTVGWGDGFVSGPLPRRGRRAAHPEARRGRPDRHAADPAARPGPGGRQGRAAHQVPVRCPARAVQPRRPAAATPAAVLDIVTQAETLAPRTASASSTTTRATPRAPRCSRPPSGSRAEEREPAPQLFLLAGRRAAGPADGAHEPGLVLDAFLLRALALAGWAPGVRRSARCCGAPARTAASRSRPAARCARTAAPSAARPRPRRPWRCSVRCSPATGPPPTAERPARREGNGLVAAYLQWHLERGLRSLPLVERL